MFLKIRITSILYTSWKIPLQISIMESDRTRQALCYCCWWLVRQEFPMHVFNVISHGDIQSISQVILQVIFVCTRLFFFYICSNAEFNHIYAKIFRKKCFRWLHWRLQSFFFLMVVKIWNDTRVTEKCIVQKVKIKSKLQIFHCNNFTVYIMKTNYCQRIYNTVYKNCEM